MNIDSSNSTSSRESWASRNKILLAAAAIVFALLLIFLPELVLILATVAVVMGLYGIIIGRFPGLRGSNRKTAAKGTGLLAGLMIIAAIALSIKAPAQAENVVEPVAGQQETVTPEPVVSSESPTPTPTPSPVIEDFIGDACDGDELVMEQGGTQLFCDEDPSGSFVWVTADEHEKLIAAKQKVEDEAKAEAERLAAEEKAAAEKAAKEKAAAEKAAKEKAAAEKAAAEKKAKQEAEKKKETTPQPKSTPKPKPAPEPAPKTSRYFKNCTEARNAGAAPVYRGEPGYGKHLDRDGDGIGCE